MKYTNIQQWQHWRFSCVMATLGRSLHLPRAQQRKGKKWRIIKRYNDVRPSLQTTIIKKRKNTLKLSKKQRKARTYVWFIWEDQCRITKDKTFECKHDIYYIFQALLNITFLSNRLVTQFIFNKYLKICFASSHNHLKVLEEMIHFRVI